MASSVELKTIPNPSIVRTQSILSATGSWQSGEKKQNKKPYTPFCSNHKTTLISSSSSPLSPSAHAHLFLPLLLFLLLLFGDCLAAFGCSPVSLKPISSITEIISLRGRVFVQRGWISQLSEAEENREERLRVTRESVCVWVCVCVMLLGCSWLLLN